MSARTIIETAARFKYYRGWHIMGSGDHWGASRHGVNMWGNSEALLKRMIDLRSKDDPYTYTSHGREP